jgi:two-component system response regulator YesN
MQLLPTDYVNLCRIEHAQVLIKQNELSLNEIAAVCGFNSYTYFSTTFKKIIGVSPKIWKKRYFK